MLTTLAAAVGSHLKVASVAVSIAALSAGGAAAATLTTASHPAPASQHAALVTHSARPIAGSASSDETEAPKTDAPETEAPETEAPETEAARTTAVPVPFDAVAACAAATSHGSYVSQVSHASLGAPDHATLVREAAHSTCGKKVHASHPPKAAKTHPAPGRKHSPTSEPAETPTPTTTVTTAQVLPTESSRRNQHATGGHSRH